MKPLLYLTLLSLFGLTGLSANDAEPQFQSPNLGFGVYEEDYRTDFEMDEDWHLFRAKEFSVDGFYGIRDRDGGSGSEHGGGVGLGHYFTRHLGCMVEGFVLGEDAGDEFTLSTSALFRIPVDHAAFALYGLVGTGYSFGDAEEWGFEIGGGIDVRLLDKTSGFFDARYAEPEDGDSSTRFRLGIRLLF